MNMFINALTTKDSVTENGMATHSTTSNSCLDFFFSISTFRSKSDQEIIEIFSKAYTENSDTALKLLFWARDIRFGQGERKLFRVCMNYLLTSHPKDIQHLLTYVPEYGRWDDLVHLYEYTENIELQNIIINIIKIGLNSKNGLCAKWLPRKGYLAKRLRTNLKLTPKEYRKLLVNLTNVVETNMCSNTWNEIEYKHTPSVAMTRYKSVFYKHDTERFKQYINDLVEGKTKVNSGAVYPYDLIHSLRFGSTDLIPLTNEQWKSLPNYIENNSVRLLPVVDTSGSMMCTVSGSISALDIAISLGIYISERNDGPFKDYFITFSENPVLQKLTGNLYDRCNQLVYAQWGMNTNIENVFNLILNQSIKNKVIQSDMPTHIIILSDMEFDVATDKEHTVYDMIRNKYAESGYVLPQLIFWNLNSRTKNFPVKYNQDNVALVSGFSPTLLKTVLSTNIDPITIMNETIYTERYKNIKIIKE